jgi:hypothetical protein
MQVDYNEEGSDVLRRNKRGIASKGSLDDQSIDLILPQQALVNFHFLMK